MIGEGDGKRRTMMPEASHVYRNDVDNKTFDPVGVVLPWINDVSINIQTRRV